MRIHLAADHAGYALARQLEESLLADGHDVAWHGAEAFDDGDDYPAFAITLGQAVIADEDRGRDVRGVIVGATGGAEAITATKVKGVRAVPGVTVEFVRLAREHVDANVVAFGARVHDAASALTVLNAFIAEPFPADPDDVRRIVHTAEYENAGTIEGWMIE